MSRAAFTVTKWRKYRNAQLYGTTMEEMIDADLKDKNPPSSGTLVELMLLGDKQYMTAMLRQPLSSRSAGLSMSLAAISHNPTHPFYKRIANAFGYVNSRRKKAGLSLDKWPIIRVPMPQPIPNFGRRVANPDFRLVWSLNRREVCAARGVFKRYVRDGLVPFSVGSDGQASRRITVFDPASCEVLFRVVSGLKP